VGDEQGLGAVGDDAVVGQRRGGDAGAALRDRDLGVETDPLAARLAAEVDGLRRIHRPTPA
jgi:hypothetical protein